MRVMIVEDQTMIRSLLESYFRAEDGYRITASIPGAKQAVEVCRTSSVDLILMDVQTENRENGLTAVRQIKAIQPKSKIIAKNRTGKQASACTGSQRRQADCRSGGRMMGFDFLLVQPQAFIEKKKPRLSRSTWQAMPAFIQT